MDTKELTAQIYEALSECFKEPSADFAEDLRSGRLRKFFAAASEHLITDLRLDRWLPEDVEGKTLDSLSEQYNGLFNHPFRHLVPVESVYGPSRSLMGKAAREALAAYKRAGMRPPSQFAVKPDHLCLLLEFMSFLCREGTPHAQREFLANHFGWLDKLREDSLEQSDSPFYRAAIEVTLAFVRYERERLEATVPQPALGTMPVPADCPCSSIPPLALSGGEQ